MFCFCSDPRVFSESFVTASQNFGEYLVNESSLDPESPTDDSILTKVAIFVWEL